MGCYKNIQRVLQKFFQVFIFKDFLRNLSVVHKEIPQIFFINSSIDFFQNSSKNCGWNSYRFTLKNSKDLYRRPSVRASHRRCRQGTRLEVHSVEPQSHPGRNTFHEFIPKLLRGFISKSSTDSRNSFINFLNDSYTFFTWIPSDFSLRVCLQISPKIRLEGSSMDYFLIFYMDSFITSSKDSFRKFSRDSYRNSSGRFQKTFQKCFHKFLLGFVQNFHHGFLPNNFFLIFI